MSEARGQGGARATNATTPRRSTAALAGVESISLQDAPLVSVLMFVRNGMPHLKRAVSSVLGQSHANFEFVIQDAASTDGSVDYLRGLKDPRIKLISEPDNGPADGFAKAMSRCSGEIIGTCLADEELVPGAIERVVELFALNPHLGAITGDAHVTDIDGNITGKFVGAPFNIIDYLWGVYCPYWCSSFFKAEALRFVGIFDNRWSRSSLEFEIWCRLSIETDIQYVPEIFSKYAHHAAQLSQNPVRVEDELEARLSIIRNYLFGPGTFFGDDPFRRDIICLLQLRNLYLHLLAWRSPDAERILDRIVSAQYLSHFNASRLDLAEAGGRSPSAEAVEPAPSDGRSENLERPDGDGVQFVSVLATAQPGFSFTEDQAAEVSRPTGLSEVRTDGWLIQQRSISGRLYRLLFPRALRHAIPRDFKIRLARALWLRGRS